MAAISGSAGSVRTPEVHISRILLRATLLGTLAFVASILWGSPAYALPSFSGQTGAPCSACHVGGFGPQLTPFGIFFKATGYTLGGGQGVWSKIPFNIQTGNINFTHLGKDRPTTPTGYSSKNDWIGVGCGSFVVAAGHQFENSVGVGAIGKIFVNQSAVFITKTYPVSSIGPSEFRLNKQLTFGTHTLVLGFDVNNQATISDPYDNNLFSYYNQAGFQLFGPTNAIGLNASPHIGSVVKTHYGLMLNAFFDNSIYAEVGVYETMNRGLIDFFGGSPGTVISGGAPYFRLAWQHQWGDNFVEVGGLFMDIPFQNNPGIANPFAVNEYFDYGLDAMYQRRFGEDVLVINVNFLYETQNLGASFPARRASNSQDTLQQFRIAATYAWSGTTEFTVAYITTWGSTDALLYPAVPLTGSIAHSPNAQTLIAQVDWAPWGNAKPGDPTFPWLNLRFGLQYRYFLQFNGGTTNYDGFGRNASDNNTLMFFTFWSF